MHEDDATVLRHQRNTTRQPATPLSAKVSCSLVHVTFRRFENVSAAHEVNTLRHWGVGCLVYAGRFDLFIVGHIVPMGRINGSK